MKNKKTLLVSFVFFTLIFFFSSGEDVPWIGIVINSIQFGLIMTAILYLVYKLFSWIQKFIKGL